MEDFGDILYILVMLGALIFSAIRKSKQTARRSPMAEPESSSKDPLAEDEPGFEDLRELFRPKQAQPQPVKIKPKPVVQTVSKPVKKTAVAKKSKQLELIDINEEDAFEFEADELDLRKAVIYSEILKRPYQ